jgi:hypothetical protein
MLVPQSLNNSTASDTYYDESHKQVYYTPSEADMNEHQCCCHDEANNGCHNNDAVNCQMVYETFAGLSNAETVNSFSHVGTVKK